MNQEHLLPKFEVPAHKSLAAVIEEEQVAETVQPAVEKEAAVATAASEVKVDRKRSIFRRMAKRVMFWNRRSSGSKSAGKPSRLIQGELMLAGVKVVRNDLKDSDFELVALPAGAAGGSTQASGRPGTAGSMGVVWNRLSARLLRQAVQDFNVVQKERGKLLSSAGSDRRSARGAWAQVGGKLARRHSWRRWTCREDFERECTNRKAVWV